MNNDALNNIKRLRDVLNEAIAAMESGREARIEQKLPYGGVWDEMFEFAEREHRCVIKPREVWVNTSGGKLGEYVHASREEALAYSQPNNKPIRFVEAINDD